MARVGRMNRLVTLANATSTTNDSDGFFNALTPSSAWCQIEPVNPGISDDTRSLFSRVTMRYHAQVTVDTRIAYGSRSLFVKGVQNVDDANHTLVLWCEEVTP